MVGDLSRYEGCLLGLACGDAVGTTVEFSPRGSFSPVVDMVGGGPVDLEPGQWTDDTSMALCLATSLVYKSGFDATDQMNRYCNWRSVGYLSSNGRCFDIGSTVAAALDRYLLRGDPFAGNPNPRLAGNGALMRLAPVAMFYCAGAADTGRFAADSTRTTHGAQEAIECSRVFGLMLRNALLGVEKVELLNIDISEPLSAKIAGIVAGDFKSKQSQEVKGSGYSVESLEAALWAFFSTEDFEQAILAAYRLLGWTSLQCAKRSRNWPDNCISAPANLGRQIKCRKTSRSLLRWPYDAAPSARPRHIRDRCQRFPD